ncbi:MAG: hypothetical protein KJO36_09265 [Acidimicrobiia bacterium]|nr:hypothetical protein [Acidimicrobiia bacterium]
MTSPHIGVLREQHLHAALKEWYRQHGDLVEVRVDGFVIDLVRDEALIEIQTRGFSAMRNKLDRLLDANPITIVHPIAVDKWIRKIDLNGVEVSRRRSPKRGALSDVCQELVSFPSLLDHPNLTLQVLLVQEEEIRRPDPAAWRRNGWGIAERRLLEVLECIEFSEPADLLSLLPARLPSPFTTADLAAGLGRTRHAAQKVAYCLREAKVIVEAGRSKSGIEYLPAGPIASTP